MASKVLIDANVLLDFTLKRDNYLLARRFFNAIVERELNGFITPSILHIVGHWLTKAYGSAKSKSLLLELLSIITVIDAPHEVMIAALNSRISDIKDSLQYYTALHHKMDIFISGDKGLKKSAIASLPVYSLNEVVDELLDN
ncbi:type II toxin-antitoxin system VapC family toxin [Arachidicoccus sp.]|uniref:type II toxin-antitoxin system VapC family toxin n=1 Tax=Arachidicoccus sp. TaxID=1872624 RepID=UPI003D1D23EA